MYHIDQALHPAHGFQGSGTSILIGLLVLALIIRRQLRVRRVRESAPFVLLGILVVLGVVAFTAGLRSVTQDHPLKALTVVLLVVSFVLAAGFGVLRATTVRLTRDRAGEALMQGTAATVALWVVSVGAHFGLDAWIDRTSGGGALGFSTVYLYLAVTLGVQGLVVRRRVGGMDSAAALGTSGPA
jgi:hypothetical protein